MTGYYFLASTSDTSLLNISPYAVQTVFVYICKKAKHRRSYVPKLQIIYRFVDIDIEALFMLPLVIQLSTQSAISMKYDQCKQVNFRTAQAIPRTSCHLSFAD